MSGFRTDIGRALAATYDLIIIGAGIYGMTLALESARRGLRPLLIDKSDFGGATSLNSLRILHGGLRYLQHMDMPRVMESIEQRSWFMRHFAPLCRALPCIMPLYGRGLKRPAVFRLALAVNAILARDLPNGKVLSRDEVVRRFPLVQREGLKGGALWYDGQIFSPQRLHAELLRWATAEGATCLNYVEALELIRDGNRVAGLVTNVGSFKARVVIAAAGPWAREVAARLDADYAELLTPSITFNALVNLPPPSDAAVAVQGGRMYFITPHLSGKTFVGTVHRCWEGRSEPTEAMIQEFVDDLSQAIPQWGLSREKVTRVTPGVLPCRGPGKPDMAHRSVFVKHKTEGLFSTCGIKYTTAQRFAVRTIEQVFGRLPARDSTPDFGNRVKYYDPQVVINLPDETLAVLAAEEAVTCTEDFMERRMDWITDDLGREQFETRLRRLILPSSQPVLESIAHSGAELEQVSGQKHLKGEQ